METKNLLIFTGGGLSPAFNSLLYGAITAAKAQGWNVLGGLYGWASLLSDGQIIDLNDFPVEQIKNIGGNFLRSSRTNPLKVPHGLEQVQAQIKKHNINAIVAIGGDDTLGTANFLQDQLGANIVCIPKTIDNDLSETYWTPGYPSASYYLADFVRRIKIHAAYTLSRIFIIEAPGFKSGWMAASGAYGLADVILPPEEVINCRKVVEKVADAYIKNGRYAVVVISQYAHFDEPIVGKMDNQADQYHTGRNLFVGLSFTDYLKSELKIDVRSLHPGNYLEAVDPIEIDKNLSILLGQKAIEVLAVGKTGMAVCLKRPDWNNLEIIADTCPLEEMVGTGKYHFLCPETFDFDNFCVKQKFFDYMEPALGKNPALLENPYLSLQKKMTQPDVSFK